MPATEATDPVGINLSETGVKLKEREVRRYAKKMRSMGSVWKSVIQQEKGGQRKRKTRKKM